MDFKKSRRIKGSVPLLPKLGLAMKKTSILVFLTALFVLLLCPAVFATDVNVSAEVTKTPGNTNLLAITVKDGADPYTQTFVIRNNAKGEYDVGKYVVYVATSGNDKIDACFICGIIGNLNDINPYMSYDETYGFLDKNGEPATLEVSYDPPEIMPFGQLGGYNYYGFKVSHTTIIQNNMTFYCDLTTPYSQYTISNVKNISASGPLLNFYSNPYHIFTRQISHIMDNNQPAEVTAYISAHLYPFGTTTWWMKLRVWTGGEYKITTS